MSDKHHLANRARTSLESQVTHTAPSAQRSLKSATNVVDKASSAIESVASSAVGSLTSGAGNDFGAKSAQTLASAASTGGRVVKITLKTSVNIVAKVPDSIQRARLETRAYSRARRYTRRKMTLRQKFIPKPLGYAIGGGLRIGSGIANGVSSGLRRAVGSGEGTGSSATGLALQSGQAALAGARAIKTGTVAAERALKTTRRLATKVTRKITNGVTRRIISRSSRATAKAAEEAAKASAKASLLAHILKLCLTFWGQFSAECRFIFSLTCDFFNLVLIFNVECVIILYSIIGLVVIQYLCEVF